MIPYKAIITPISYILQSILIPLKYDTQILFHFRWYLRLDVLFVI